MSKNRYKPLSSIDYLLLDSDTDDIIDYLDANGYKGIINDLSPLPHIQYDVDDLKIVVDGNDIWTNLQLRYGCGIV